MILKNIIITATLLLFFTGCLNDTAHEFVRVQDNRFEVKGKPYFFAGTNIWYGVYIANSNNEQSRNRLIRELDCLQELGITNIRLLGSAEGAGEFRIREPFQPERGVIREELLQGLDFVLAEMDKREMKAVIYLNNYWEWSGGMAQYVSWVTGEPFPNPNVGEYQWSEFMDFAARFYSLPEAVQANHEYIRILLNRRNSLTGVYYRDDPVIMSWQLANEPRPGRRSPGYHDVESFHCWIKETAALIKSLDKNHLVSVGSEGTIGCLDSDDCYTLAHGENIDYLTLHIWIKNWEWFDPQKPIETLPSAKEKVQDYVNQHLKMAKKLNKPLVVEEFGCPRDGELLTPKTPTTIRDDYFQFIFNMIYQDAANKGYMAGSNFWAWGGEGQPPDGRKYWLPGDDFIGDPPQEPQGLNSIFTDDKSTLAIIKKHAKAMKSISD